MVLELAIQAEEPAEMHIRKLPARACKAKEEISKVQLELNLQIAELQLKAQPSTPPKVKKQCTSTITTTIAEVNGAVKDCTKLFKELFEVLTTLQEGPNIQCLETEAREVHQKYDEVKGTTQTVALTQRLARMQ